MIDDLGLLAYAYIGDSYYELLVRNYLVDKGFRKVKDMKEESLKFVSAKSQADILNKIMDYLSDEEKDIVRRGRNVKTNSKPKYCDILTYKYATALEVLIGYLYRKHEIKRISDIFSKILEISGD